MSATSDKEIIQGIVTEIMNARSAGSVTNTMVAQVLRYCVDTLGGRIEDLEGKDESEAIESLAEIAAFLAGITDSQTLSGILSGLRSDLHGEVVAESEARQAADTALDGRITTISEYLTQGYSYGGIASVSGTPGSGRKFYFAVAAGTYTNYGGLTVGNEIAVLKYDGTNWSKDVVFTIDNTPTAASVNPVKSGGVYDFVLGKTLEVVDVANLDTFKAADLRKSDNTQKYLLNYNGRNCGTLHIISDNAGHVVTQIITTHYSYDDSDGTIDWNSHSDNNVVQLYRSVKISGGTLPDDNWTRWNYVNNEILSLLKTDIDKVSSQLGYYRCNTAAATAAKTIDAPNYVLAVGGCIKIKFTNANTVASGVTLKIGSAAAMPLYYAGQAVSASNTWQAGETVEVYYDGTNYQANNVAGGGGDDDSVYVVEDNSDAELNIGDKRGYIIAQFKNGHVKTKNFDSSAITVPMPLLGKTVTFFGDSITAGTYGGSTAETCYVNVFKNLAGCNVINAGVGGATIAQHGSTARIISQITSARVTPADLVVVFGGTNDQGWGLEIGDLFSTREVTDGMSRPCIAYEAPNQTTLFGGALHEIVTTIRSLKPHVPILFITPLKKGYGTTGTVASNCKLVSTGLMMDDYIDAIKKIADYYCIPVFDAGHMSLIDVRFDNSGNYWSQDNVHILVEGNKVLANLLYKFIVNNIFIR